MRVDRECDRGNIGADTEIVNDGAYLAYAEVTFGPWVIEFSRGREQTEYMAEKPERVTVKGLFIGEADGTEQGEVMKETTVGTWSTITEAIDTWDYVERCDEEVYSTDD
jgi:hypothetical protein